MATEPDIVQNVKDIIENDLSFKLSGLSSEIKSLLDQWKIAHPQEAFPSPLMWELTALDAMPDIREARTPGELYYRPLMEFVNRDTDPFTLDIYPDVKETLKDDNAITYYIDRFNETSNPIRKARFADLLWEALKIKGDRHAYKYGIEAGRAYLSQIGLFFDQERGLINLTNNLQRVAEISVVLNSSDLASNLITTTMTTLPRLLELEAYHYISEQVKTLEFIESRMNGSVQTDIWKKAQQICVAGIVTLEKQEAPNDLLLQALVNGVIICSVHLGENEIAWKYRVKVAEIQENEAYKREKGDYGNKGSMVALRFMHDALNTYLKLVSLAPNETEKSRIKSKIVAIKREVRRLIKDSEAEMKTVSVSFEVPLAVLEQSIMPLLNAKPEHLYLLLCSHPDLIPQVNNLREEANRITDEAPLFSLLGKTSLRDGRIVDETQPLSKDENLIDTMRFWFQTQASFLDFVFHRLRQTGQISKDSLLSHLQKWEFIDEMDLPFIEKALDHYFHDDHISALHLLTPRIEHMIKSAFEQVGLPPVAVPNEQLIREQTFGEFLRRNEVKKALGENVWYYLNFVLVDEKGLNLRNDIAHGWIGPDQCNRINVQIALFCMLLITMLVRNKSEQENL